MKKASKPLATAEPKTKASAAPKEPAKKDSEEHDVDEISFHGDDEDPTPIPTPIPTNDPAAAAATFPQPAEEPSTQPSPKPSPLDIALDDFLSKAQELDRLEGKLPDASADLIGQYVELASSAAITPEILSEHGITLSVLTEANSTIDKIIAQISSQKHSKSTLQALLARNSTRSAKPPVGAGGGGSTSDDESSHFTEHVDDDLGTQPGVKPTSKSNPFKFSFPHLDRHDKDVRDMSLSADTSATEKLVSLVKQYIQALLAMNLKASEPYLAQIFTEAIGTFKVAPEAVGSIPINQARDSTQVFATGRSGEEEAAPPSGQSVPASRGEAFTPERLKELDAAIRDSVLTAKSGEDAPPSSLRPLGDGSTQRVFKISPSLYIVAHIRRVVQLRIANAIPLALAKIVFPKHLKHEIDGLSESHKKILQNTAHSSIEADQVPTAFSMLFSCLTSHINTGVNGLSQLRRVLRPRLQTSLLFRAMRTIGNNYILRPGEHLATQLSIMDKKRLENVDGWKPDSSTSWRVLGLPTNAETNHFELLQEPLLVFIFVEQLQELVKLPSLHLAADYFTADVISSASSGTLTVEDLQSLLTKCTAAGIDLMIPKTYKPAEPLQLTPSSHREPAAEPEASDPADVDQHGAFGAIVGNKSTQGSNRGRARGPTNGVGRDRQRSSSASQSRSEPSVNIYASARSLAGPNFENLAALVTNLNTHIKEVHGITNYFSPRGPGLGPKTPPDSDWSPILTSTTPLRKDFYFLYMFLQDTCRSTSSPVKLSAIGQSYRDEKDPSWTGLTKADVTRLFARRPHKSAAATLPAPRDITIYEKIGQAEGKRSTIKEFSS